MSFAVTVKDAQDLRRLIPLNILSASRFEELCAQTGIEEVARGSVLFNQGDARNEFVYVLSGTVSLQAGGMEMETITGGTESARFALAHQIPRKVSAVAKDRVRYICVDADYVNQPTERTGGTVATYEVSDIPDDSGDDWVATLLKSPIFQRLPPANLQNILSILEEVPVRSGQEIIHQDEPGDYYYVIKRGRCALTRKPSRLAREIKLAELKTCDTFGEDSLISDQPRNVTVTMTTDGTLLRLSKANFLKLVKEPVINFVNMDVAQKMIPQGARWLDVRAPDSFEEGHLPGALNIPFFKLRMELANLSHQGKYILVCETGKVSEAAAFLLIRHEFNAFVLKGGVSGVFKDQLVSEGGKSTAFDEIRAGLVAPHLRSLEGGHPLEPGRELPSSPPISVDFRDRQDRRTNTAEEVQVFRNELAALKTRLNQLQRDSDSATEGASELRARLEAVGPKVEEVLEGLRSAASDVALLKEARQPQAVSALQLDELRSQLARAEAAKHEFEERMQAERRESDLRREASEANLRNALAKAEMELKSLEKAFAGSRAENDKLRVQLLHLQESTVDSKVLEPAQALGVVESALEQERDQALQRNRELEGQVTELSALLQEFIDQRSEPAEGCGEEVDSLKAELDMVRVQAEQDVIAMQRRLGDAEQESGRLRAALESAQQQLLLSEVAAGNVSLQEKGRKARGSLGSILSMIGMLIVGAVLVIALAAGTDAGRRLTLDLVVPPEQNDSSGASP